MALLISPKAIAAAASDCSFVAVVPAASAVAHAIPTLVSVDVRDGNDNLEMEEEKCGEGEVAIKFWRRALKAESSSENVLKPLKAESD